MLVKTIKFENLDGKQVQEQHHFNLTRVEFLTFDVQYPNGLEAHLKEISEKQDNKAILDLFTKLIDLAYGVRDGSRFVKTEELLTHFKQTPAYDALVFELLQNATEAIEFFIGCLPKGQQAAVQTAANQARNKLSG